MQRPSGAGTRVGALTGGVLGVAGDGGGPTLGLDSRQLPGEPQRNCGVITSGVSEQVSFILPFLMEHSLLEHCVKKGPVGASLVALWLRICLPMQGTRVRALAWEDPTCRGATKPVSHNY